VVVVVVVVVVAVVYMVGAAAAAAVDVADVKWVQMVGALRVCDELKKVQYCSLLSMSILLF
jgi:hypothetical protein